MNRVSNCIASTAFAVLMTTGISGIGMAMSTTALAGRVPAHTNPHHRSHIIRPYTTLRIIRQVTRHGITYGTVTEIARFRLPGAPRGYHAAELTPSDSTRGCAYDGGYTFQGCMTQYYSVCNVGSADYVNVTKYTERWTPIDPSGDWQLKGPAGMRAGVFGGTNPAHCGGKGGIYGNEQTKTIRSPRQDHTYTESPSWAGAYVSVEQSGPGYQCGNAYLQIYNYIHPSRHWTFEQPDVCQGYPGLGR